MSGNLKPFTSLASVVFAVVSLAHLLRLVFAMDVVVDGVTVPLTVSFIAALVAAGLSMMTWRESRG